MVRISSRVKGFTRIPRETAETFRIVQWGRTKLCICWSTSRVRCNPSSVLAELFVFLLKVLFRLRVEAFWSSSWFRVLRTFVRKYTLSISQSFMRFLSRMSSRVKKTRGDFATEPTESVRPSSNLQWTTSSPSALQRGNKCSGVPKEPIYSCRCGPEYSTGN